MKPFKFNMFAGGLAAVAVVLVAAYITVARRNAAVESQHPEAEPVEKELARLRTDAPRVLLDDCTNSIVGLSRIITTHLDDHDDLVSNWRAEVTAEFVNKVGGIERTNMPFIFSQRGDFTTGRAVLYCSPDYALILKK